MQKIHRYSYTLGDKEITKEEFNVVETKGRILYYKEDDIIRHLDLFYIDCCAESYGKYIIYTFSRNLAIEKFTEGIKQYLNNLELEALNAKRKFNDKKAQFEEFKNKNIK